MESIEKLNMYSNRQVIINFYNNEELVDRKGFDFDRMIIEATQLQFVKNDQVVFTLPIESGSKFMATGRFKNHYQFTKGDPSTRIEIYFP